MIARGIVGVVVVVGSRMGEEDPLVKESVAAWGLPTIYVPCLHFKSHVHFLAPLSLLSFIPHFELVWDSRWKSHVDCLVVYCSRCSRRQP